MLKKDGLRRPSGRALGLPAGGRFEPTARYGRLLHALLLSVPFCLPSKQQVR